jgi:hypothetical protein
VRCRSCVTRHRFWPVLRPPGCCDSEAESRRVLEDATQRWDCRSSRAGSTVRCNVSASWLQMRGCRAAPRRCQPETRATEKPERQWRSSGERPAIRRSGRRDVLPTARAPRPTFAISRTLSA